MLLEIKNLHVQFETDGQIVRAVDGVSLTLDRGQILGIVGESGCGKSATAMSIPRLLPMPPARIGSSSKDSSNVLTFESSKVPSKTAAQSAAEEQSNFRTSELQNFRTSSEILFDGRDLLTMPLPELRKVRGAKIGVIFQDPLSSLSPLHRIGRQIEEVIHLHRNVSPAAARETAIDWLGRVGIPDPAARALAYPHELSGGMRQRVMIAMALVLEPVLIIADEPTTALDVTIQAQVLDLMRKLHRKDSGILLITHDMGVIAQMATRVAVMYAGQIVEQASAPEFFAAPRHPYSVALLNAMPSLATRGKRLQAITGHVPLAGQFPGGCRFHDRCPRARPECAARAPEFEVRDGRLVRCPY